MTTILKTTVHKTKNGFMGRLTCFVGSKQMWSQDTDIVRATVKDAMQDAIDDRDETAEYNCLVKTAEGKVN